MELIFNHSRPHSHSTRAPVFWYFIIMYQLTHILLLFISHIPSHFVQFHCYSIEIYLRVYTFNTVTILFVGSISRMNIHILCLCVFPAGRGIRRKDKLKIIKWNRTLNLTSHIIYNSYVAAECHFVNYLCLSTIIKWKWTKHSNSIKIHYTFGRSYFIESNVIHLKQYICKKNWYQLRHKQESNKPIEHMHVSRSIFGF